ncbi:PA2779 family protein [Hydrogenobaculum acidophilum]
MKIKKLAIALATWTMFYNVSPAMASFVSSKPPIEINSSKSQYIKEIQKALENKVVAEKLKEYGMNPKEVKEKLKSMNEEQLKLLANASEKLNAGGDALGLAIAVLVIVLLVVLILRLAGKEVIIR